MTLPYRLKRCEVITKVRAMKQQYAENPRINEETGDIIDTAFDDILIMLESTREPKSKALADQPSEKAS
jgi:hypothetical protein